MAVQKECMYLDGQMKNLNPKRYKGDDISSFILSLNEERIIVFLKKNQPGKLTN